MSIALEHLGRSLLGSRFSGETLFTMVTCYFDEAGDRQTGWMFVCGWAASVAEWESFELDWKLFLAKFNVPHFHMKEFTQSKGCYANWKDEAQKRTDFLAMGAEIIRAHVRRGFASLVSYEDMDAVDRVYELKKEFKTPYAFAGRACIALANKWRRTHPEDRNLDMEYVFEDGAEGKGSLVDAVQATTPWLPIPSFKPSRNTPPSPRWPDGRIGIVQLQSADFLAYELRKLFCDMPVIRSGERPVRKSLIALPGYNLDRKFFDLNDVMSFCERAGIPRRGIL